MPRKGAELWTGRRRPGEGAAGVPWCPSSFFLGPCLPRQHPHGRDRLLLRVPLPGSPTLSLLPPHASDTHSGGDITASCPSGPNAGLQVHGEGGAGRHYCSKTDSDKRRRVATYSDSSRSERCGNKSHHGAVAAGVLLPRPLQTPLSALWHQGARPGAAASPIHSGPRAEGQMDGRGARALPSHRMVLTPLQEATARLTLSFPGGPGSWAVGSGGHTCLRILAPPAPLV